MTNSKEPWWHPLCEFSAHVFVMSAIFVLIASFAVVLGYLVDFLSTSQPLHVNSIIIGALECIEYILFAADLLVFLVFIIKTTLKTSKKIWLEPELLTIYSNVEFEKTATNSNDPIIIPAEQNKNLATNNFPTSLYLFIKLLGSYCWPHRKLAAVSIIIFSVVIFIGSMAEVFFHLTEADGKYPFLEVVFDVDVKKDDDTLYWQNVISNQEPLEKCQSYLEKFPSGKFLESANECIEKRLRLTDIVNFEKAKNTNTISAYREYIIKADKFSNYISDAEKLISILEENKTLNSSN